MLSDLKGWIIAAIVLVMEIVGVGVALSLDAHTPPTAISAATDARDAIAMPIDARTIVTTDQPGDAGDLYRAATEAYLADAGAYETFLRDRDRSRIARLRGIANLIAATHLRDGKIFAARLEDIVVYGESPSLQALEQVGNAAITAGLLLEKRDAARARQHYDAAFSLGMRLFDERITFRELMAGVGLMSKAGACIAEQSRKAGRADEADAVTRFLDAQRDYHRDRLLPIFEAIYTFNEPRIGQHAGDVFTFVQEAQQRVWRVEAAMKLGRMRFNAGLPGRASDQRHAMRLVSQLSQTETDPAVRRAATLARDLTVEQYRMLR